MLVTKSVPPAVMALPKERFTIARIQFDGSPLLKRRCWRSARLYLGAVGLSIPGRCVVPKVGVAVARWIELG